LIKPLKKQPLLPSTFLIQSWTQYLLPSIHAIYNSQSSQIPYQILYNKVEDICQNKQSSDLYTLLYDTCNIHIESLIHRLNSASISTHEFLKSVNKTWNDHCQEMITIRSIFLYFDRTYLPFKSQSGSNLGSGFMREINGRQSEITVRSVWDLGLYLWRLHLDGNVEVEEKLIDGMLELIDSERSCGKGGEELVLIKSLVRMVSAVGLYGDLFEMKLIQCTKLYFSEESKDKVEALEVSEYLVHVETRLRQEVERCQELFEPVTRKELVESVEMELLVNYVDVLIEKGFEKLCESHKVSDLKRMYGLFGRVRGLLPSFEMDIVEKNGNSLGWTHEKMRVALLEYVKTKGINIVMDVENDSIMIKRLIEWNLRLDELLNEAFGKNEMFHRTIKEGFEYFINKRENKPAELIAKFIDQILRTGNKSYSEGELEKTLDQVVILFRFVEGKDIFEAFYQKDLGKRLLFQRSASLELEKMMISKIKAECGAGFTHKLEIMFKDVDVSVDILNAFHAHQKHSDSVKDFDLNVYVLTNSYWPNSKQSEIKIPQQLARAHENFEQFYLQIHSGKRLSWQFGSGSCQLKANFPKGIKLLDVSLHQTVILLLFNNANSVSFTEIRDAIGLEDKELKRTLLSLCSGKVDTRVLMKEPKGASVSETDMFSYNELFVNKLMKIKINSIQMKETSDENKETTERVFQDRQFQIDAAIVRIMKTKKSITHSQLIAQLYTVLKFPHKPSDLKKRIESLIEREYLERDPSNNQMYQYIA